MVSCGRSCRDVPRTPACCQSDDDHCALPVSSGGRAGAADGRALERLQSRAIREALADPCIVAALARGVPRQRVVWRHAFRLALKTVLAIYGIMIGTALSGSFVVEIVMSWHGLGDLMYQALQARDLYLVAGCAAAGSCGLAFGILTSDLALVAVDPRVEDVG